MNLLMILLIVLAIWVCAAICYFAWRLTPDVEAPGRQSAAGDDSESDAAQNGGPAARR